MAEINSYPNNSDEYIGAEEVMRWHHGRTKGVYAGDGNAAVTAVQNSMAVSVAPGIGWITDADGDGICWWFDSAVELAIDAAESTGTLNRIDRVIIEWKTTDYADKPEIKILKGTNSSSAVAPALTNNSTVRQMSLARISIPAGTISLTALNIIDERQDPTVCGIVTETVTADTSMIAAQYSAAIQTLYDAIAQAWAGEISDGSITKQKLSPDLQNEVAGCRKNLLENWYFVGGGSQQGYGYFPLNSNGQTVYSSPAQTTIDRWGIEDANGSITVDSGSVTFSTNSSGQAVFWQLADSGAAQSLLGKTVTLSVLATSGLYSSTFTIPSSLTDNFIGPVTNINQNASFMLAFFPSGSSYQLLRLGVSNNGSVSIIATKLEIGSTQTLAHLEGSTWVLNEVPSYGEEYAETVASRNPDISLEQGTYTLDSGVALKDWGKVLVWRYGKLVVVTFSGLYFTSAPNNQKGINVPYNSNSLYTITGSKDGAYIAQIGANGYNHITFNGVNTNTNIYGELFYFTND